MKQVYNTGRVKIGLAYEPKTRVYHDRDACRLQKALLFCAAQDKQRVAAARPIERPVARAVTRAARPASGLALRGLLSRLSILIPTRLSHA